MSPRKPAQPLDEAAARAELAAGRPVPLEWLWLLGDAEITVTNPQALGKVIEIRITEKENEDARNQD